MNDNPVRTLAQLRADLPITRRVVYLQTGSYAPVPRTTQRYMSRLMADESATILARGRKGAGSEYAHESEAARLTLAEMLGVDSDEVAWSYNTTTATRLAVRSLDWKPGDKLALTDVEHASTLEMAQGMQEQVGVATTVIPTGYGPTFSPEDALAQLDRRLTPDHRLLIMSHVANADGRRLPVAEAVRLARDRGVKTLIDGAQAIGVFPVSVGAIGADFYTGSGHKWLMGPPGVGFLIVARHHLDSFNPNFTPTGADTATAATRSELGTPNDVLRRATAYGIRMLADIGHDRLELQMRTLTRRLRSGLAHIEGVRTAGPDAWEHSSSITTLQLEGGDPERCQQLVATLRDRHQIVTKHRPEVSGVRVSIAAFNTEDEIDRLLEALAFTIPRDQWPNRERPIPGRRRGLGTRT